MKQLNEDLKTGKLKNVYLLCGEEAYLKRQYRNRIRRAVIPEGDTMNYAYYEGKNIPVPEIIDLAETMPFFAERRLIVIENSGFFPSTRISLGRRIKAQSAGDKVRALTAEIPTATAMVIPNWV